jgi:hypothetical protein
MKKDNVGPEIDALTKEKVRAMTTSDLMAMLVYCVFAGKNAPVEEFIAPELDARIPRPVRRSSGAR